MTVSQDLAIDSLIRPESSEIRLLPGASGMPHLLTPRTERIPTLYREIVARSSMNDGGSENRRFLTRIAARLENKLVLLQMKDVFWIQSKGNFACLHAQTGDFDCRTTMNDLSMRLDPDCFLRVHRNAIVNLNHVLEFDLPRYGNGFVHLSNGASLPISRTGRMALRRNLLTRSYEKSARMQ